MDTSVKLQDMLSYATKPIVIMGVVLGVCLAVVVIYYLIKFLMAYFKKIEKQKPVKIEHHVVNKATYLRQLDAIATRLAGEEISLRDAFQEMSLCIRDFVQATTGIKVQNYTLDDIKELKLNSLTVLIEEYYAPEFARESVGDFMNSLEKTKRTIEKWN